MRRTPPAVPIVGRAAQGPPCSVISPGNPPSPAAPFLLSALPSPAALSPAAPHLSPAPPSPAAPQTLYPSLRHYVPAVYPSPNDYRRPVHPSPATVRWLPVAADIGADRLPPFAPQAMGVPSPRVLEFEHPTRGQPLADVTAAITPSAPPLPHAEATYASDAAARAAADIRMAATTAEQVVATLQSAVMVLAAAGASKLVVGMSPPAPPASPWHLTATASPLTKPDPRPPGFVVVGAALDLFPPPASKPGLPLWPRAW